MAQLEDPKPRRIRVRRDTPRGEVCLNCEAELSTRFCPHCGQENVISHLSLGSLLRDFFVEFAYYDSKLWRTLRTLVAHPGRLSSEWAKGRRAKYVSPIKLYLWITFLFFLAIAGRTTVLHFDTPLSASQQQEIINELKSGRMDSTDIEMTRKAITRANLPADARAQMDEALNQAELKTTGTDHGSTDALTSSGNAPAILRTGWLGRQYQKLRWAAKNDQNSINQGFRDQIPKVMFLVLPLIAGVLKLIYWRQHRYFVEHVVFILHVHSFAFLCGLVGMFIPSDFAGPILTFWVLGYGFMATLRFYRQPWWLTLLKGIMLGFVYLLVVAIGSLLALLLTVINLPDPPPDAKPKPAVSAPAKPPSSAPAATQGPSLPAKGARS